MRARIVSLVVASSVVLLSSASWAQPTEPRIIWFPDEPVMPNYARLRTANPAPVIQGPAPGAVVQVGEIVVIEGDSQFVAGSEGAFGIDPMNGMPLIGQRFYSEYPDEFDGLAVFTSFEDVLNGGAYSISAGWSGATNNGWIEPGSGAGAYGSEGRLIAVVNMNQVGFWGSMTEQGNFFHAVFGQEITHTWLAFFRFRDPVTGDPQSMDLLARQQAHWSAIVNSNGSVQDGLEWFDNEDGTFTAGNMMVRYGPLDLYGMGVYAPEEVTGMFIIRNATHTNGTPVDPFGAPQIGAGTMITGERVDISIDDIVAAEGGPRSPAWDEEKQELRVAWILVTEPGQTVDDVMDQVAELEVGRKVWERTHYDWTFGRSTMCTDTTAPCPTALATVDSGTVIEYPGESDGDGIIEPGEGVRVDVSFFNPGSEDAVGAVATLSSESPGVVLPAGETIPVVPAGMGRDYSFRIEVTSESCGKEIELGLDSKLGDRVWNGQMSFRPGETPPGESETFETSAEWTPDPRNVQFGGFEHGVPVEVEFGSFLIQPEGGADGRGDPAWFTGPFEGFSMGEVVGEAALISAPIDVKDVYAPRIRFDLWYVALDRGATGELTPSLEEHLIIDASVDGGQTWTEIDRVSSDVMLHWETHELVLDELAVDSEVMLRFKAIDYLTWQQRFLEVGIDNLRVAGLSERCDPSFVFEEEDPIETGGCGCVIGQGQRSSSTLNGASSACILGLLALLWLRRRRRG